MAKASRKKSAKKKSAATKKAAVSKKKTSSKRGRGARKSSGGRAVIPDKIVPLLRPNHPTPPHWLVFTIVGVTTLPNRVVVVLHTDTIDVPSGLYRLVTGGLFVKAGPFQHRHVDEGVGDVTVTTTTGSSTTTYTGKVGEGEVPPGP